MASFESLSEQLLYFLGEHVPELKIESFQVNMFISYFFDKSLLKGSEENGEIPFDKNRILNRKVGLDLIIFKINDFSPEKLKEYDSANTLGVNPPFIVDYDEFASRLLELEYDVKYRTFEDLLTSYTGEILPFLVELTSVNLEPKKDFKQ